MTIANIVGRECRFVVHVPSRQGNTDIHLVKEITHYPDGRKVPGIRLIKDFERPFWITRPSYQNHADKKEWEDLERLDYYTSTESNLQYAVAQALNRPWSNEPLQSLLLSPYVYGADITSATLIKNEYAKKWPNLVSAYSVATFDIETDVVNGTGEIIIASLAFQNRVYTAVTADFVAGISHPEDTINEMMHRYLSEYIEKRQLICETYIGSDVVDIIRNVFAKAHEWRPDFLAIWNIDFDIPRVLECLQKYNVDPTTVLCDPNIPTEFRLCKYRQGKKKKITASGMVTPINPASQWHTLFNTASFYAIDAMCAYKHIRLTKQEEPSYALDAILNKELGIRKLKFTQADEYQGLRWHQVMQTLYKLEYIVYNRFDCISMLELDEKTKDLSFTLPAFSGNTPFYNFNSQPKRIVDALYIYGMEKGKIIGSVGRKMRNNVKDDDTEMEEEPQTLSLKDWIVTLASHLTTLNGLRCIEEDPNMVTNIRVAVADSDSVSSYPSCILTANVSKETTLREIIGIQDIPETVFRLANIDSLSGHVNALGYCNSMFGLPNPLQLLSQYKEKK